MDVYRRRSALALHELLQHALRVLHAHIDRTTRFARGTTHRHRDRVAQRIAQQRLGERETAREIRRRDQGLEGIGERSRAIATTARFLAAPETQGVAERDRPRGTGERRFVDRRRACAREQALVGGRQLFEQLMGDNELEDRITEQLESLVIAALRVGVLVDPCTVRERLVHEHARSFGIGGTLDHARDRRGKGQLGHGRDTNAVPRLRSPNACTGRTQPYDGRAERDGRWLACLQVVAFSELPSPPTPSGFHGRASGGPKSPSAFRLLIGTYLPFILSALWAAIVIRLIAREPRYAIPIALVALIWIIPLAISRMRQRRMLLRGNVPEVLEAWAPVLATTPYPETLQPLLIGTAYAANGWVAQAREAVRRAVKGEAWSAADEQRRIIETLLETFDGDRERAVRIASDLPNLPLPPVGVFLRRRISALRLGMGALARAFGRVAQPGDRRVLMAAAKSSPLFHWAFSYAAAVVAIDEGDAKFARKVIKGAPNWPQTSVFHNFHAEIEQQVARIEAIANAH